MEEPGLWLQSPRSEPLSYTSTDEYVTRNQVPREYPLLPPATGLSSTHSTTFSATGHCTSLLVPRASLETECSSSHLASSPTPRRLFLLVWHILCSATILPFPSLVLDNSSLISRLLRCPPRRPIQALENSFWLSQPPQPTAPPRCLCPSLPLGAAAHQRPLFPD